MKIVLAQSPNYVISHEHEIVSLIFKKSGSAVIIGDFYGDPETAYISHDESYCVIGGCGLIIYYLREPFSEFEYKIESNQWKEVFRDPEDIWWVADIEKGSNPNRIRFYIDSNDEQHRGNYEIDVFTLESIRVE